MKIKDIQIDGFGVWSGLTVNTLPEGMTVFYGPNEAGKTTLMQFLRTMLYGFTPERRQRYLPPVFGGKPGGAMRVTGPGGGYEITRRTQIDDPTIVGSVAVTSSDGVTQGQHRLTTLLGNIDESIFTNVFAIGLRELQELSTLDDTTAADELYKLSSGLDRVSLVDVMRQLKGARTQIVGPTPEEGQMQTMIMRREKLRDELEHLTNKGRRWAELAIQNKTQRDEVEELRGRIEQWELESKIVETALQVRKPWSEREQLRLAVKELAARTDIPDDARTRLNRLETALAEKKQSLEKLKLQRRELRTKAMGLPLRKGILALSSKIDAAAEQAPWIGSLQKQIFQLESQVHACREQLIEDAKRLGLNEEDQQSLLNDKRMANMPDLSPQAISQLAGPAREVRVNSIKLKQAKEHAHNDKKEVDRLGVKIEEFLTARGFKDLPSAVAHQNELISALRRNEQIEERLEKNRKHRKELEEEALELERDQALPMDHTLLHLMFVSAAVLIVIGLLKTLTDNWLTFLPGDNGLVYALLGVVLLFVSLLTKQADAKNVRGDLADCLSQIDVITSQIRKTEQDRSEILKILPEHAGSLEQRLKEAEHNLGLVDGMLPIAHNHEAASQRYHAARKRGIAAAEALKTARNQWRKVLEQLGLASSLSPKSLRMLAEGYESLVTGRRRLKTQQDELDQRRIELTTLMQRIDGLTRQISVAREGAGVEEDLREIRRERRSDNDSRDRDNRKETQRNLNPSGSRGSDSLPALNRVTSNNSGEAVSPDSPVAKIQELSALVAQQQQYITQKKQLRSEDEELRKRQKTFQRTIEKIIRTKNTLLAELAVESPAQLDSLLDTKQRHVKLLAQVDEQDVRIRAILGGSVSYEAVQRLLEGGAIQGSSTNTEPNNLQLSRDKNTTSSSSPVVPTRKLVDSGTSNGFGADLERRWDLIVQRIQQAQERVGQLQLRQGETTQEMKTLAADRRLAEVNLELAMLDKQLELASEHWRTLAATSAMLEQVCDVYETERQPETLREASAFLKQLTEGKYHRVWTPLGKNALQIDNEKGQSLPLEVLSRGTREAVFIALRLSLAAAYARRGATLPLVLDDVLVNFDTIRAQNAAKVLRDFSALGHQSIMFTCHEHIMRMFHDIGVQVRILPAHGEIGEAKIYTPDPSVRYVPAPQPIYIEPEPIQVAPVYVAPVYEKPVEVVIPEIVPEIEQAPVEVVYDRVVVPEPIEVIKKPRSQKRPKRYVETNEMIDVDHVWFDDSIPIVESEFVGSELFEMPNAASAPWIDESVVQDEEALTNEEAPWWRKTSV
ncbi:MAG: AAA family ATPase [Planctomycetota bacterium]|nr:AAA family ATPase [Planctomycetota bacterium]